MPGRESAPTSERQGMPARSLARSVDPRAAEADPSATEVRDT
jgi:hypothetical protein